MTHLEADLGVEVLLLAEGSPWMAAVWALILLEAALAPAPDLDVMEPDLIPLEMQPEVFLSLFLDVGDLGARLEGFLVLYLDVGGLRE